jgi:hypothetical protein
MSPKRQMTNETHKFHEHPINHTFHDRTNSIYYSLENGKLFVNFLSLQKILIMNSITLSRHPKKLVSW